MSVTATKTSFSSIAALLEDLHTIAVASLNAKKIAGAKNLFPEAHTLSGAFNTNVSEYPYGAEAIRGCFNRLAACEAAFPQADAWISAENGAFDRGDSEGNYLDRPLVVIKFKRDSRITWALGQGAIFPRACLEEAHPGYPHRFIPTNDYSIGNAVKKLAFEKGIIVPDGGILVPKGTIVDARDPHLALTGKSRATIIEETYRAALAALDNKEKGLTPNNTP